MKSANVNKLNEFYIGFKINQINKEFDLLRFGLDNIINIEVKQKSTLERVEKQLRQNRYYLSFIGKEVYSFTYLSEEDSFYQYDNSNQLIETNINTIAAILKEQDIKEIYDINRLFKPSNYLVSPFNATDQFLKGEYFLTQHQNNIKNDLIGLFKSNETCFASIVGVPGTGKTLLTYDIANDYIKKKYKVQIIHCANLNKGHHFLNEYEDWNISPIKNIHLALNDDFDLLIVDEAQRLKETQLKKIVESVKSLNVKCIFSYDPEQCLSNEESSRNIGSIIEEKISYKTHKLTKKIRTNKEIASFIKGLFNLNKINYNQNYPNIGIQYFASDDSVREYSLNLYNNDWKIINFTKSQFNELTYDEYQNPLFDNSHAVIGQEYDKVVIFIDEHFYYDEQQRLRATHVRGGAYAIDKMLYQNITRTRDKLTLIIVRNKPVLKAVQSILKENNSY